MIIHRGEPDWRYDSEDKEEEFIVKRMQRVFLLTDAKGNSYLLLSGEQMKPLMTPERMNLLEEKVKVEGILVTRGGIQGIYVKKMEKAK